jgi:hypothetical protein
MVNKISGFSGPLGLFTGEVITGAAATELVFVNVHVLVEAALFESVAVIVMVWLPKDNPLHWLVRSYV